MKEDRFIDPMLIKYVLEELDKDHIGDNAEKLAVFVVCATSLLLNPRNRVSAALKGDSSEGKDNAINANLKHFPEQQTIRLTGATKAVLEDDITKYKLIAFSEVNMHREGGANKDIVETFKQLSEFGLASMKKDARTGYKTLRSEKQEQKTLLYGTTETEADEELSTRFVVIPIRGSWEQNKAVTESIFDNAASEKEIIRINQENESWIKEGLKNLTQVHVIVPFATEFKKPLGNDENKYIFDYSKARVRRDSKRLLDLTRAITFLHQKQRPMKILSDSSVVVYSLPIDFLLAYLVFADFFNITYSGVDHRHLEALEAIKDREGNYTEEIKEAGYDIEKFGYYVPRQKVEQALGKSRNTIKDYLKALSGKGLIKQHYDKEVGQWVLVKGVKGGVNRLSLPITIYAIDTLLTGWLTRTNYYKNIEESYNITYFVQKSRQFHDILQHISEKLTGVKLTGEFCQIVLTEKVVD